jgi:hypothetical protein
MQLNIQIDHNGVKELTSAIAVVNVSDRIDHNGVKELTSAIAENIHDNVHELFLNRFGTTVRNVEFGEDQLCLNL